MPRHGLAATGHGDPLIAAPGGKQPCAAAKSARTGVGALLVADHHIHRRPDAAAVVQQRGELAGQRALRVRLGAGHRRQLGRAPFHQVEDAAHGEARLGQLGQRGGLARLERRLLGQRCVLGGLEEGAAGFEGREIRACPQAPLLLHMPL